MRTKLMTIAKCFHGFLLQTPASNRVKLNTVKIFRSSCFVECAVSSISALKVFLMTLALGPDLQRFKTHLCRKYAMLISRGQRANIMICHFKFQTMMFDDNLIFKSFS